VARGELDPGLFRQRVLPLPDGPIAVETIRVLGAAMADAGVVGIGRLTVLEELFGFRARRAVP